MGYMNTYIYIYTIHVSNQSDFSLVLSESKCFGAVGDQENYGSLGTKNQQKTFHRGRCGQKNEVTKR